MKKFGSAKFLHEEEFIYLEFEEFIWNLTSYNNNVMMRKKESNQQKSFFVKWFSCANPSLLWTLVAIFTIRIYVFLPENTLWWQYGRRYLRDKNNQQLLFYSKRYNWMGRRLNAAVPLDYADHPDAPKLVIATLVSNHQTDVDKLCRALESLTYLKG